MTRVGTAPRCSSTPQFGLVGRSCRKGQLRECRVHRFQFASRIPQVVCIGFLGHLQDVSNRSLLGAPDWYLRLGRGRMDVVAVRDRIRGGRGW